MPTNRPRRRDEDDEDDDDDRPRRRRRDEDDEDEDDRPRSRRDDEDDDEDDDRPRRRRRWDDEYDDRPRRRPRRRSRGGPSIGKVLAIVFVGLAGVGLTVLLVMLLSGSFRSVNISYEKYAAITQNDTIESLDKKLGPPTKFDRGEWGTVTIGEGGDGFGRQQRASTLADFSQHAKEVTAWYRWQKGDEEVYVAEGTDFNGRKGLVIKIYFNPKVVEDLVLRPEKARKDIPWFHLEELSGRGVIRFGGSGR